MFRSRLLLLASVLAACAPAAFCDTSLQDYGFSINGTYYSATTAVPGLTSSGFNTTTGQGSVTFTFNKAGTYNLDAWFFNAVSTPFYNEYGAKSGTPLNNSQAVQSYQIDIPDYDSDPNHTGNIIANTKTGKLDNTNHIPGTADDYLGSCATGSNCNDAASMAMGFKFSLLASQTESFSFSLQTVAPTSKQDPGGFYLEQIHPVDGGNPTESDLFFFGTVGAAPPPPPPPPPPPGGSPEPASAALVVAGVAALAFTQRRRWTRG